MKKLIFGLLVFGFTTHAFAQVTKTENLPEVVVTATNYKYLNSVNPEDVADISVKTLEEKVASFDLKNAEFYQDEYDLYRVEFYIPDGVILAAYDKDGNIIRTVEKFKDVQLPTHIMKAVGKKYPKWGFAKDSYLVNYHGASGETKKIYKIKLQDGNKTLRVKVDGDGNFL